MLGRSVLLYAAGEQRARDLAVRLRAAGNEVDQTSSLTATLDLMAARAIDLVLFARSHIDDLDCIARAAREHQLPLVALSVEPDAVDIIARELSRAPTATLLEIATADPAPLPASDENDIVAAIESILQKRETKPPHGAAPTASSSLSDGVPVLAHHNVQLSDSLRLDLRSELASVALRPSISPSQLAHSANLQRAPRRRPKATPAPIVGDSSVDSGAAVSWPESHPTLAAGALLGLDTLRAVLRGAASIDQALESALRYLASQRTVALCYRRDGESLTPHMATGHPSGWYRLGRIEPWLRAPSTPALVARSDSLRSFAVGKRGLDRRIADLIDTGRDPRAPKTGWALPISADGTVRFVLCLFGSNLERVALIRQLLELRGELEDTLLRLESSPSAPYRAQAVASERARSPHRAPTEPPYAELELLFGTQNDSNKTSPHDELRSGTIEPPRFPRAPSEPYAELLVDDAPHARSPRAPSEPYAELLVDDAPRRPRAISEPYFDIDVRLDSKRSS